MKVLLALACCSSFLFSSGIYAESNAQREYIPQQALARIEQLASSKDATGWKTLYYDVLSNVIKRYSYKTVVEVGVALGGHAEFILNHTDVDQYFGVDPYMSYDPNDGFQHEIANFSPFGLQKNFDYLYQWVKNVRLSPYQKRCQLIRKPSAEAAFDFDDESIDCIFIDGDHRYDAVLEDLNAWFPKLKPGHLILGDDYWMQPVAAAVQQFFSEQGREIFFFTSEAGYNIWAAYK